METNDLLWISASSVLLFAAVFLTARWIGPVWDTLSGRVIADLAAQMRSVSMDTSRLPIYMRWWGIGLGATLFISTFVLRIPLIGIGFAWFVYIAPHYVLDYLIARRRSLLRDQMVGASVVLANSARAGLSLAQGLESLGDETPVPLALEFRRIVQDYGRGRPLPDTIRDAKERLLLDGFTLFASALLTCLDRGGRVTEALERISRSLQENQRLERKLEADTATGRKVVILLMLFPLAFLLGFYVLDPPATEILFTTVVGQCAVLLMMLLMYISARWAKKILTIDLSTLS